MNPRQNACWTENAGIRQPRLRTFFGLFDRGRHPDARWLSAQLRPRCRLAARGVLVTSAASAASPPMPSRRPSTSTAPAGLLAYGPR